jgi:hypothetical protein
MPWTVHFDDDYNPRSLKQTHDTKEEAIAVTGGASPSKTL